ncbi:hypothetical protein K8I61_15060 [bacterium]|nr:hypothetical protein [bacterium]
MTSKRTIILAALLLLASSVLIVACMGDDPEGADLYTLLREGRRSLEAGDAGEAYNLFLRARGIAPDHPAALWGTVLANNQLIWRNLTGIIDLLSGVYVKEPSRSDCERACERIESCDYLDEFRTDRYNCVADCPFKLQPFMFEEVLAAPTCEDMRYGAAEWIVQTTPQDCRRLCESLDRCGNINPPTTYDVDECIEQCPRMYVEKHSKCYLNRAEFECHRFDRTCFEHTVVGLQVIINQVGDKRIPETLSFVDRLIARPDDYQYYLRTYKWELREPVFEINLPGRFSDAELYLSAGLAQFWHAFVRIVAAQNLDINVVTFDQFTFSGSICKVLLNDFLKSIRNTMFDPIFPNAGSLLEPYEESVKNMSEAGDAIGHMFGEWAKMLSAILASTDNQYGRAVGYRDTNRNFRFDDDEFWPVFDLGIELSKTDTINLMYLFRAFERNFLYEEPIDLDLLKPVLVAFDFAPGALLIELIKATGRESFNPSYPFKHPTPEGWRPAMIQFVELLEDLRSRADGFPEILECGNL